VNENYIKAAKIMEHYGARHQLVKLCEECGELIQQAAKCADKETDYNEDMIEEMADVTIMIMQFMSILPRVDYALFRQIIREKLDRQLERIKNEGGQP
jgi:NTP pyrophosphatase (non-canonical NTP hydrolase)